MDVLKLRKPVMIDGKEVSELKYDLDALTGSDIQEAVKELQQSKIVVGVMELDMNYHAALFAKATGIAFSDMARISARDYGKAVSIVRDFFLEDSEESSGSTL